MRESTSRKVLLDVRVSMLLFWPEQPLFLPLPGTCLAQSLWRKDELVLPPWPPGSSPPSQWFTRWPWGQPGPASRPHACLQAGFLWTSPAWQEVMTRGRPRSPAVLFSDRLSSCG